jgi:integrase
MKKLTDPRLRKLTAEAIAEARQTGKPARRALDGQSGYLYAYPTTGKTAIALRPRINGKPVKITYRGLPLTAASVTRWLAEQRELIAQGTDPRTAERAAKVAAQLAREDSLRSVCERYLEQMERRGQQRAIGQVRANLERVVFPSSIAGRPVVDIHKGEFVKLFDHVERERGPVAADKIRGNLSTVLRWFAGRSDSYVNPLLGLERRSQSGPRRRILDDAEIRAIWAACGEMQPASFGMAVRLMLLTATRRNEAMHMPWSEVNNGGLDWTIAAARYKGPKGSHDHLVPLSGTARAIIESMPKESELVFANRSGGRIRGFAEHKRRLDELSGVRDWRLHDLRRTARTLLSRAGVPSDHAERCLGHVIGGVRGVYDRYEFRTEKLAAFESLARLVDWIVNPAAADNVVPMRG